MSALVVPLSTHLVTRLNRREAEIKAAGKAALALYKEQGEDLIKLREACRYKRPGFQELLESQTRVKRSEAYLYIKVAENWENLSDASDTFALRALRGVLDQPEAPKRKSTLSLTRDDAEYVLKINALAEQGATDGERDAAEGIKSADLRAFQKRPRRRFQPIARDQIVGPPTFWVHRRSATCGSLASGAKNVTRYTFQGRSQKEGAPTFSTLAR